MTNSHWVGLKNYITAFTANKEFVNALWFTVKFAVVSVVTINVLGFAMASLLTRGIRGTTCSARCCSCPTSLAASCWAGSGR